MGNLVHQRTVVQPEAILVTLSLLTKYLDQPGALAYALSYGGKQVHIFYDRVLRTGESRAPLVLAHVS